MTKEIVLEEEENEIGPNSHLEQETEDQKFVREIRTF